jgi:glycosyltransferase involved in cell wall biosynthesis
MSKITVFMPVYNSEKYLKESIDSILNQTIKEFEFLIIDDGSTDSSVDIIKQYNDDRIRLVCNEENKGLPYTRSKGLSLATGEYIALLDSDDISYPNRLEEQINYLDKNKDVIAVSSLFDFYVNGHIQSKKYIYKNACDNDNFLRILMMFTNPIMNSAAMFRKSFIEKYNINYRKECFVAQDYAFWTDCIKYGKIHIVPLNLIAYRTGHASITKKSIASKALARKEVTDSIRSRAIKNVGFELSDQELMYFNKVFSDPYVEIGIEDFFSVKKILDKLIDFNIIKQMVDKELLTQLIKNEFSKRIVNSKLSKKEKLRLLRYKFKYETLFVKAIEMIRIFKCISGK